MFTSFSVARSASGIVNDQGNAQLPVSNNIAELPGLVQVGLLIGLATPKVPKRAADATGLAGADHKRLIHAHRL